MPSDIPASEATSAWQVARTDDNGQRFVIASGLGEDEARSMVDDLSGRGHKQFYEAAPMAARRVVEVDLAAGAARGARPVGRPGRARRDAGGGRAVSAARGACDDVHEMTGFRPARPTAMVYRGRAYQVGAGADYDQHVRQGGFDWPTHRVSITGVGPRRVQIDFGGRPVWVTYDRVRPLDGASTK